MDYNTFGLILAALFVVVVAIYYFFIRVKMDPRVKELAEYAYKRAGEINGLKTSSSPPPVQLKPERFMVGNVKVYGNYKWRKLFLFAGPVIWDRIIVITDLGSIFSTLVHEMTHAVRRRNGKKSSEVAAEAAEAIANQLYGGPKLYEMLKRFEEYKE